jgi:hypothetical protein
MYDYRYLTHGFVDLKHSRVFYASGPWMNCTLSKSGCNSDTCTALKNLTKTSGILWCGGKNLLDLSNRLTGDTSDTWLWYI